MAGNWIDLVIAFFVAVGVFRGYRRGLVREVFSLVGALLAVAVAYQGYQELSFYLMEAYPIAEWLAQLIAFGVLVLGISIAAGLFGYVWSRIIRLTPFAFVDHLAGAGLGVAKVGVITILLVAVVSSLGLPPLEDFMAESRIAQQVMAALPYVYQQLDSVWPRDWPKPGWLFPDSTYMAPITDRYVHTPLKLAGFAIVH